MPIPLAVDSRGRVGIPLVASFACIGLSCIIIIFGSKMCRYTHTHLLTPVISKESSTEGSVVGGDGWVASVTGLFGTPCNAA